jgi:hypothetical protein
MFAVDSGLLDVMLQLHFLPIDRCENKRSPSLGYIYEKSIAKLG